ncbi:hypothetical protein CROQUDRAFT_92553 [Cronartium quercuum f. sp. fusiforme G11]|uniref:Uncharacterized protein n=1 Tax=Cronartium quercuum f. sp. fusiforme G11 TaxID=708437 RepID=A0A9P6TBS1_9BASI|nr:hypothetical protein CROQUDRAFT_92553 [Cronartium quercuum f. sp. fusiforme G11]
MTSHDNKGFVSELAAVNERWSQASQNQDRLMMSSQKGEGEGEEAMLNDESIPVIRTDTGPVSNLINPLSSHSPFVSSAFSSLATLSPSLQSPTLSMNPIEPSYGFSTSQTHHQHITRPTLTHSQFSSFCSEINHNSNEFHVFEPNGLFSHHEETEIETDEKDVEDQPELDDNQPQVSCSGWQLAQRLRDAALSDWESHRPITPVRPDLNRNSSSQSSFMYRHVLQAPSSRLTRPQLYPVQTGYQNKLASTIRNWALQSSLATSSTSSSSSEFRILPDPNPSPSTVFISSPLAGKPTTTFNDDERLSTVQAIAETSTQPFANLTTNRSSCSPLYRHVVRRSISSSTTGFVPTLNSLSSINQTTNSECDATLEFNQKHKPSPISSKDHSSVFEEADDHEIIDNHVELRPKNKRNKSCSEIIKTDHDHQKDSRVDFNKFDTKDQKNDFDKFVNPDERIDFNKFNNKTHLDGLSILNHHHIEHCHLHKLLSPLSPGNECGRNAFNQRNSYFPVFIS